MLDQFFSLYIGINTIETILLSEVERLRSMLLCLYFDTFANPLPLFLKSSTLVDLSSVFMHLSRSYLLII